MGLEDQSVEFSLWADGDEDDDVFVDNPGDYVDAMGFEALLETLVESDNGGRRGAPPAARSAVEGLRIVEVKLSDNDMEMEVCIICKDRVYDRERKVVKELECGHVYHGECIVKWLGAKNSCPVCRVELPMDDAEYEEDRKMRSVGCCSSSSSSRGGGGGG